MIIRTQWSLQEDIPLLLTSNWFSVYPPVKLSSQKVDYCINLLISNTNGRHLWLKMSSCVTILPLVPILHPYSFNNVPLANHIPTKTLLNLCPPSPLKALHLPNPDCKVWIVSYNKKKGGHIR